MIISPQQLSAQALSSFTLVDVREPWEREKSAFPAEELYTIPLGQLPEKFSELPQDKPVVAICHHGVRSLQASLFLKQEGYQALSLRGGIDAWAKEIDPHVPLY